MSDRVNGIVKFFNEDKGFGFITPNEGGKDIFVHRTGLVDCDKTDDGKLTLFEGQKVSFMIEESDRKKGDGKKATLVEVDAD